MGAGERRTLGGRRGHPAWTGVLVALVLSAGALGAQAAPQAAPQAAQSRPVVQPITPPAFYVRALAKRTRTADGRPGPRYWTNHSTYDVRVELDPATARVTGEETIVYQNDSPDTLTQLVLHTHLDVHRAGTIRNETEEVTSGVELESVTVDGAALAEGNANQVGRWSIRTILVRARLPH